MKVTIRIESVPGTFNKRYFCRIEDRTVDIEREGNDAEIAGRSAIAAIRSIADGAERYLKEMIK